MFARKIRFDLFKQSGKWYAGGEAFVDPSQNYFEDDLLLEHIDSTQEEIGRGSISSGRSWFPTLMMGHSSSALFIGVQMPKHILSKEDLAHLSEDQPYFPDINPRIESEYGGCDYCMSEWVNAEEYEAPKKEGFKIDEIVVDDE